jgi:DNA-binding SARP family transcriptional activator
MPLDPLELVCFGTPSARVAGREPPPELRWHKHLALLIYLALSPGRKRSRDHLLGLLWAEQPERNARKSLNEALHRLRGPLGKDRLRTDRDVVELSGDRLDVDALQFSAHAQLAPERALPFLRGEFLEGFHLDNAQKFDDWMMRERERYQTIASSTLVAVGESRLNAGRLEEAADLAHRALALAPRSDPAVRLLMRAYVLAADVTSALGVFHEFATRLQAELNEQPSRSLIALVERIRMRMDAAAGKEPVDIAPLVGREREHRLVFDTIALALASRVGPRVVIITGAPGMGRSRLLTECLRRLELEGALVFQSRPVETDQDAPWSALRALLTGLADAPGLPGAPPQALAGLAALVPELAARFSPREPRDIADVATALAEVLRAITEERPVAIALDDAHWADGATVAALGSAVAQLKGAPLVLLVTVAQGMGEPPRELLRLQSAAGRDLPGVLVDLGGLADADLAELVARLVPWCEDSETRERLTRRVSFESAGNPFFATTLLRSIAKHPGWPPPQETIVAPLPDTVPNLVQHAIAMRVAELSADQIAVLAAASICGQTLDLELIGKVSEKSLESLEQALPALERKHLIQFDGRRYAFVAPLIAQVVQLECLTRGDRRALKRRAAEALTGRTDLESRVLRAELLAHGQPDQATFDFAVVVAEEARHAGAQRLVHRAIVAAERASQGMQFDRRRLDELRAAIPLTP